MIFKWLYDVFNNDCIVLAIIVVIVLSFLWVSRHGKPVKLSDNGGYEESGNDYAVCASPECIRCQRYDVIRIAAPHRLRVIADQSNWEGLERIQKAFQVEPPELLSQFQQPNVFYMPDIAAVPWWPSVQFTEVNKILQNNFGTILSEFLNVFEALKTWDPSAFDDNNLDPVQMGWLINDTPSGCWCVFHLYNQGVKIEPSCAICPRTAELLETLPGFMHSCVFGNASFSVVYPQTVIAEHFGPCNVRIRCHLGKVLLDMFSLIISIMTFPMTS